ncbi:hypothetical protein FS837_011840 [Tulasnella sp. UAMH 9824]|nr:hypothetical protein FS837_011840 [Tulasnella sp. UAMH 9824]
MEIMHCSNDKSEAAVKEMLESIPNKDSHAEDGDNLEVADETAKKLSTGPKAGLGTDIDKESDTDGDSETAVNKELGTEVAVDELLQLNWDQEFLVEHGTSIDMHC